MCPEEGHQEHSLRSEAGGLSFTHFDHATPLRGSTTMSSLRSEEKQQRRILRGRRVACVVLGDFGRSPRMQYHALSLLRAGAAVTVVGYEGEALVQGLTVDDVEYRLFRPFQWRWLKSACWPLFALLKFVLLIFQLSWCLLSSTWADIILVQNPPSAALPIVVIISAFRGSRVIVDWHNLGFTTLSLALGCKEDMVSHSERDGITAVHRRSNLRRQIVHCAKIVEVFFARQASAHLAVTKAMAMWLKVNFGLQATTFHDSPPDFFQPTNVLECHELFSRLGKEFKSALAASELDIESKRGLAGSFLQSDGEEKTLLTERLPSREVVFRSNRPALLVSSTSWTEDEDFGILLDALVSLDQCSSNSSRFTRKVMEDASTNGGNTNLPFLVVIVTGKGPLKEFYREKMNKLALKRVAILTMWLTSEDYPKLLGCADLGVSLHTSTSGIDLPMKIWDMFGCGVPVCAATFGCIDELVSHGVNGYVFENSKQLAVQLQLLLKDFPNNSNLQELGKGVHSTTRWNENWEAIALPVIRDLSASPGSQWSAFWKMLSLAVIATAIGYMNLR